MKKLIVFIVFLLSIKAQMASAGFVNGSMKWQNRTRIYSIYVPDIYYTKGVKVPLLMGLHGFGDEISNFKNICMTGISDTANFICVYPQAMPDSWFGSNAWNSGATLAGVPFNRMIDDAGFLNALLDTVISKYMIDESRVYAFGFSFGAFMTQRLACENADRFAAVAAVSGTVGNGLDCQPSKVMPIIYFHGTKDDVINYYNTPYGKIAEENRDFWALKNLCNPSPVIDTLPDISDDGIRIVHFHYEGAEAENVVEFYKALNGEHKWLGLPDNDISYCQTIWAFFKRFKQSTSTSIQNNTTAIQFEIFPNPANNHFNIKWNNDDSKNSIVRLFNLSGSLLKEYNVERSNSLSINESLPAGTYLIQITNDKSNFATQKIIVF